MHAAAGFPTKRTWLKAIKKDFCSSWPGLIARAVEKYFPESEETQKGHMRSVKAVIRPTNKETMRGTDKDTQDSDRMEEKTKQK